MASSTMKRVCSSCFSLKDIARMQALQVAKHGNLVIPKKAKSNISTPAQPFNWGYGEKNGGFLLSTDYCYNQL